jgi:hypothetical protein
MYCIADNDARLILRRVTDDRQEFLTCCGHLSEDHLTTPRIGQAIQRGQRNASNGPPAGTTRLNFRQV